MNFAPGPACSISHFHSGGVIYAAYPTCIVAASTDGEVLFRSPLCGATCMGSSGVMLLIGTLAGKVIALNSKSGMRLWEMETSLMVTCLAVDGNRSILFVGAKDGSIAAWDLYSRQQLWSNTIVGNARALGPVSLQLPSPMQTIERSDECRIFELGLPPQDFCFLYLQFLGMQDPNIGYIGINRILLFEGSGGNGDPVEYNVVSADGSPYHEVEVGYTPNGQIGQLCTPTGVWWCVPGEPHSLILELPCEMHIASIGIKCANAKASPTHLVCSAGASVTDAKLADRRVNSMIADSARGIVLSVADNGSLKEWAADTGEEIWEHQATQQITAVTAHGDLALIFTGGAEGSVSAWSCRDKSLLWDDNESIDQPILGLTVNNKLPGLVFAGGKNGSVAAWQADSGENMWHFMWDIAVLCVDFEHCQSLLVLGTMSGHIWTISGESGNIMSPKEEEKGNLVQEIRTIAIDVVKGVVFTSGTFGPLKAWVVSSGELLWHLEEACRSGEKWLELAGMVVDSSQQLLVTACSNTSGGREAYIVARIASSGEKAWSIDLSNNGQGSELSCIAIDPARNIMVYGRRNGCVAAHAANSGAQLWAEDVPSERFVNVGMSIYVPCIAVSPSLGLVLSGRNDGTLKVRHVESGALIWECKASDEWVLALAVDDGRGLAFSGCGNGVITAWHSDTGERVWSTDAAALLDVADLSSNESLNKAVCLGLELDRLFVGFSRGVILALSPSTGVLIRRFQWHFGSPCLCTGGGLLVSGCLDMAALDVHAFAWYGVVIENPCGLMLPTWQEQLSPVQGGWGTYALQFAVVAYSACQMLAFASDGPAVPARAKTLFKTLKELQTLGLKVSSFQGFLHNCEALHLHFEFVSPFLVAFCLAAFLGSTFNFVVVFQDLLEDHAFDAPRSCAFILFKILSVGCQLTARIAFLPTLRMLLLSFVCVGGDKSGLVLRESTDIVCGHQEHIILCVIAVLVSIPFIFLSMRLAAADFSLQALEVNHWRPWDMSKDSPAKDRLRIHPLTSKNVRYDVFRLVTKLVLIVNELVFMNTKSATLFASVQASAGIGLLTASWFMDPCFPNQVNEGRYLDPNSVLFSIDALSALVFLGNLVATLLTNLGMHGESNLQWLLWCSLPFVGLGYWIRKPRSKVGIPGHRYVSLPAE